MLQAIKLYSLVFTVFSVLFIFQFWLGILSGGIFFYRGLLFLIVSFFLTFFLFFVFQRRNFKKSVERITLALVTTASLHLAFFILVPVTLDRSVSVFLLKDIYSNEQGITKQELINHFFSEYTLARDAVGRRIYEQESSSNVKVENGVITMTNQGKQFLLITRFIERLYGI